MDSAIKIYTSKENDISDIRKLLNSFLLKYRVYKNQEYSKDLPIIELWDKKLVNPTLEELKEQLGLRGKEPFEYYDTLIIGTTLEAFFFRDYAKRHNLSVLCIDLDENIEDLQKAYSFVFTQHFLDTGDDIIHEYPQKIEFLDNRRHIRVRFKDRDVYFKSMFVSFSHNKGIYNLPNEKELIGTKIFEDFKSFRKRFITRRPDTKRKREFYLIGNSRQIFEKAFELYGFLEGYSEYFSSSISIVYEKYVNLLDPIIKNKLKEKKIRVVGKTHVKGFKENGYKVTIKTDLRDFIADYIIECNSVYMNEPVLKRMFYFDIEGYIETDHNYKTKYPNIYAMWPMDIKMKRDDKNKMLDRYIECAEVVKRIEEFLDEF